MQTRLLLSLLIIMPLFAQEVGVQQVAAQVVEPKTETIEPVIAPAHDTTKQIDQNAIAPWTVTIEPAAINVEFYLVKTTETVEEAAWENLRTLLGECKSYIDNKQFEQAIKLFDQINTSKSDDVKSIVMVRALTNSGCTYAQIGYSSAILPAGKGQWGCLMGSISRANVSSEVWKDVTTMALNTIRANQELPYDQSKQLAFTLIAKA